MNEKGIFITGTDTNIGKTIATLVLGVLAQEKGIDIGVMKPVQCAGNDDRFLKRSLGIKDPIEKINPYLAKEPLSPHLAFARQKEIININRIKRVYDQLSAQHDLVLVEGAGGLMVPLKNDYLVADLIKDLDLDVIIVARLGLGTINHTLLTIRQVQEMGLNIRGVVVNQCEKGKEGTPEQTNPDGIKKYGNVPILGTIPYLQNFQRETIKAVCTSKINIQQAFSSFSFGRNRVKQYVGWDKKYLWHPG